jgi:hypothetical protein
MKYLKRFESASKEIKEFCETYLIDLIDLIDICCSIDIKTSLHRYEFQLFSNKELYWKDVKYSFLPFLQVLIENYSVFGNEILFFSSFGRRYSYTIDQLLSDDLPESYKFYSIGFKIITKYKI